MSPSTTPAHKVVFLSAGSVAADAATRLHAASVPTEITVADLDLDRALEVVRSLGLPDSRAVRVDASDPASVRAAITGADVVFNGVGPYYRFGLTVAREAVAAGAHYVDICDEYDVAHALVTDEELDRAAKAKDLVVLTGMGASPGVSNLLARWAFDQLDETESIEVIDGLPLFVDLGVTINAHMLHALTGDVLQHHDGDYVHVPALGDPQPFDLLHRGRSYEFAHWGHPEAVTIPRYLPVPTVNSRFTWFQPEGMELYRSLGRWGLGADRDGNTRGPSPREFLAGHMATEAGAEAMSVDLGDHPVVNVWQVVATGTKDGRATRITLEAELDLLKKRELGGPGLTGLPAAMGLVELLSGGITARGVLAPEACLDPEPFLRSFYEAAGATLTRRVSVLDELIPAGVTR